MIPPPPTCRDDAPVSFVRLSSDSQSHRIASLFPRIIDLSHTVFWLASDEAGCPDLTDSFEAEASRRMTEDVWRRRLKDQEGVCYVALTNSPHSKGGAFERPVGFVLAHRQANDRWSPFPPTTVHLWITGVDPAFRRRGIMHRLVAMLTSDVRAGRWGDEVRTLSVRTIPTRFGAMVAWLETDGWVQVEEPGDEERRAYRKSLDTDNRYD